MKAEIKTWDYLSIFAVVALIGVFVGDILIPNPSLTENAKKVGEEQALLQTKLKNEKLRLADLQLVAQNRLWRGAPEKVSPMILQEVTRACTENGVSVARFRPQRGEEAGDLNLQAYAFNAEGRFPQVMQMIRTLESSRIRIAVTQTNLSASSEENDTVSATVTIAVFVDKPKEEKTSG